MPDPEPDLEGLEAGLIKALNLKPDELPEAKYNLLGFFSVLYKIDQRLRKEAEAQAADKEVGRDG